MAARKRRVPGNLLKLSLSVIMPGVHFRSCSVIAIADGVKGCPALSWRELMQGIKLACFLVTIYSYLQSVNPEVIPLSYWKA